jgi:hypothetical protein
VYLDRHRRRAAKRRLATTFPGNNTRRRRMSRIVRGEREKGETEGGREREGEK